MDTKKILADLYSERKRIDAAITALEALSTTAAIQSTKTPAKEPPMPIAKKRVLSPEGRKRIAEAARKRWARQKKAAVAPAAKKSGKTAAKQA